MGVTIHYKGTLNDLGALDDLVDEMEDFAKLLGWRTQRWNGDWSKPNTSRFSRQQGSFHITGHIPLRGITLYPHQSCEPLYLTFDPRGNLDDPAGMALASEGNGERGEKWLSTKTQFAPIELHAGMIKLLRYLRDNYILDMEVLDEGGYWESGDLHELKRRFDTIDHTLDILEAALLTERTAASQSSTPEELVQMIEGILKRKFGEDHG